jgi:hypothetical protein
MRGKNVDEIKEEEEEEELRWEGGKNIIGLHLLGTGLKRCLEVYDLNALGDHTM